jgi:hypothetical protein
MCREAAFEEPRRVNALRPGGESISGPAPAQLVYVVKQRRIGAQRGKALEQQRLFAALAKHLGRERFDWPMPVQQTRCTDRADAGDARVAVGGIADQCEEIRNQRRDAALILGDNRYRSAGQLDLIRTRNGCWRDLPPPSPIRNKQANSPPYAAFRSTRSSPRMQSPNEFKGRFGNGFLHYIAYPALLLGGILLFLGIQRVGSNFLEAPAPAPGAQTFPGNNGIVQLDEFFHLLLALFTVIAVCWLVGTEIAQPLFRQTSTTGAL